MRIPAQPVQQDRRDDRRGEKLDDHNHDDHVVDEHNHDDDDHVVDDHIGDDHVVE